MNQWAEQELHGWGRHPRIQAECRRPERRRELIGALEDRGDSAVLAHGLGRSYGDAALLDGGRIVLTERLDRMLSFDAQTGWLRAEAGVSLKTIIDTFTPRGWFPPVVPGTQFVTLGGALANDIHGKSHHVDGTFSDHVRRVEMLTASGEIVICDRQTEPALFHATVGGLGLTGIVLTLEMQLRRIDNPFIEKESIRIENLDHFFEVSAQSRDWPMTVSWIDCIAKGDQMGRGIFMRGRPAAADAHPPRSPITAMTDLVSPFLDVPFDAPGWIVNKLSMRLFNETYFHKTRKGVSRQITHYAPFHFPLDFVGNWNRMYGERGMLQYQLVVPHDPQHAAIREVLSEVSRAGMASFLAVIKEFGEIEHSGLSFPRPGVTLALDFPNCGAPLHALLDRLDAIVVAAGGRLYLGKDARLSRATFRQMYPEWESWRRVRDAWDPEAVFQSDLGLRLGLCGAS